MSSRGRGYGRGGGYEGKSRGGGYSFRSRGSSYRGGGRGGYNDRGGGRGGYYVPNERYSGSSDRYSGRNERSDDMGFRKPYRNEGSSNYGSREHMNRGGSPERKRMRMEGSSGGGRRSHEGNHYAEYGREDRRGAYGELRRSPPRESYHKAGRMLPPTRNYSTHVMEGRGTSRIARRSFRSRPMRTRGTYRGMRTMTLAGLPTISRIRHRMISSHAGDDFVRKIRAPKALSPAVKTKVASGSSSEPEENWDADEKSAVVEEATENDTDTKAAVHKLEEVADGEATDKEAVDAASGDEQETAVVPLAKKAGKSYIRLSCTHCQERFLTFKVYAKHLQSTKHRYVMDSVALKLKLMLQRMRTAQRNSQRTLEDAEDAQLSQAALFCSLCKLIFRTTKDEHFASKNHRNMKKFLLPFCKTCALGFRSPMLYEHHICSLEHIKKKAFNEMARQRRLVVKEKEPGSGDDGMDVDLDKFMTLDSVGDVDEVDDEENGEKKNEDGTEKAPAVEINVGSEHIQKIEVQFCDLCNLYLQSRGESEDIMIRRHCRTRNHLTRYMRFRDDRVLRLQAERIHRSHQAAKESNAEAKDTSTEGNASTISSGSPTKAVKAGKENGASKEEEEGEMDDKLWADVDKELGDLLREVNPTGNKSSDDEDESSNTGRYDRFRKSDKKSEALDNDGAVEAEKADKVVAVEEAEVVPAAATQVAAK